MRKGNPGRFAESGSAGERPGFRKSEFVKPECGEPNLVYLYGFWLGQRVSLYSASAPKGFRAAASEASDYADSEPTCINTSSRAVLKRGKMMK